MGIPGRPRAPESALRGDMDRMASSMKQVPNPLPKVLSRRGVGTGMEAAERESFERTQVRTGVPRDMHGWGTRRDAVSRRGFEGNKGLAGPGEDGARGAGGCIWCSGRGDPGKVGDPGIPAGLGKRAGRLRGAGVIRAARPRVAGPGGTGQGSRER